MLSFVCQVEGVCQYGFMFYDLWTPRSCFLSNSGNFVVLENLEGVTVNRRIQNDV